MPITYIELSTAKLVDEVFAQERAAYRSYRRRKSIQDFATVMLGLVAIGTGFYLGHYVTFIRQILGM
jgi:hypothetical protein